MGDMPRAMTFPVVPFHREKERLSPSFHCEKRLSWSPIA
jgi:hypothetical protein